MLKQIFTVALLAVSSIAAANSLTINYVLNPAGTSASAVDVYLLAEGDNDGLLNFDLSATNLDAYSVPSDGITFSPVNLYNLRDPDFVATGFNPTNAIQGPSGSNDWSALENQFQIGNPIPLGREAIDIAPAVGPPDNNPIVVSFDPTLGSHVGSIDLGVELSVAQLEDILGGGGTLYGQGDASTPISLDGPATVNVVGREIPEPATALLAGLAAVGFVARRR